MLILPFIASISLRFFIMHAKMEQAWEPGRGQNAVVNLCYKLVYFNICYQLICFKFSHFTIQHSAVVSWSSWKLIVRLPKLLQRNERSLPSKVTIRELKSKVSSSQDPSQENLWWGTLSGDFPHMKYFQVSFLLGIRIYKT